MPAIWSHGGRRHRGWDEWTGGCKDYLARSTPGGSAPNDPYNGCFGDKKAHSGHQINTVTERGLGDSINLEQKWAFWFPKRHQFRHLWDSIGSHRAWCFLYLLGCGF